MSPRYLGCAVVLVKSFARIHETNLKKQGILPLTFKDPRDYDRFGPQDRVSVTGLATLAPGKPVTVTIRKPDGRTETDRKSTRLNSSHLVISYAVFCLKKKKIQHHSIHHTGIPE